MKSWQLLGYLGLLPFITSLYLSVESVSWVITAKQDFVAYSAIIVSFIAGSIWRKDDKHTHTKQQIISNSFSLLAFISLLTYTNIALIILSFSFLFLYVYERDLAKCSTDENRTSEYMAMRFWLTLIVISMHITAYILWFY
jgi:heme/copper-type cytochrome/quinol oxidase subunit 2